MPGVIIVYSHTEKRFIRGMEVISTHYSDDQKDYPLNFDFYQPNAELQAKRQEEKKRQKAKVNARKPAEVLEYLKAQVDVGNKPDLVVVSGNRLNRNFCQAVEELKLNWLGVSDNRRTYLLNGQQEKQKAKSLLAQIKEQEWIQEEDTSVRIATLGLATSTVGPVLLIAVEHVVDQVRRLYLVSDKYDESEAIIALLGHLAREKECQESGILHQMLDLLREVRFEAGIKAENTAFDSWFCIPWFIREVLKLGFGRVVTKARENFNYTYDGKEYKLGKLWDLLDDSDFESHKYKGIEYKLASLKVSVNGIGLVKLLFMRHPTRRGNKTLQAVLLCTDIECQNDQILRVYKLRWRIEVCYREVKQNHLFGQFHARNANTIYGQTLLSLVAYTFVSLFRLLVPPLINHSLGEIVEDYLNVIVDLTFSDSELVNIEFQRWLVWKIGLPDFSRLSSI